MKKFLFALLIAVLFLILKPGPVFCVYCMGGSPCFSNTDCSLGCRCQSAPFQQGVCLPQY